MNNHMEVTHIVRVVAICTVFFNPISDFRAK